MRATMSKMNQVMMTFSSMFILDERAFPPLITRTSGERRNDRAVPV